MVDYSDSSQQNKRNELEKYPGLAVFYVEQNRMFIAVRIDRSDDESCNQSAEKGTPQCFHGKIVADLE